MTVFARCLLLLVLCLAASSSVRAEERSITLLFTNDFESAYEPTPAFWRQDLESIGGVAQLASLIDGIRAEESHVFLFDAGDIFTGTLAKLTKGAVSFDLMMTMGYDAMSIGNHEFEYGWQTLAQQKSRVSFPVLGANLFYAGTEHPYAQPYTILERDGVRVGVIGILGQDAATALIPANIVGVDVKAPIPIIQQYADLLSNDVDLTVVLIHQGPTAPMQTNDEADTSVQRGNAENFALAGAVTGVDVILAGHTDAGTPEPLKHPDTGTLVMQTYGQGQHLGYLQLSLDASGHVHRFQGKLISVDSDALDAAPGVVATLEKYRRQFPEIYQTIGQSSHPLIRRYYVESDLGNLFADILRQAGDAPIGLMPSGALRRDLPRGAIRKVDLLDVFPFQDRVVTMEMTGQLLLEILEQGLSLQRGILQVSGLKVIYDSRRAMGKRVIEVSHKGSVIKLNKTYRIATVDILAQGGDAYTQFKQAKQIAVSDATYADFLERYFATQMVTKPPAGRLISVDSDDLD